MTGTTHDWLPDRHLGVSATLSHADELIGEISDLLFLYQTQEGGIVGLREEQDGSVSKTVVDRVAPMPRKIPLLVADALVALRAAIEHTIFAEVEQVDGPLNEKAAKLVEMPASETYDAFEEWKKKRRRNGPASLQAGSELVRRIDGLQPFHRQKNPQMHPLARLVSHTNHAKHRTPAVTAVRIAALYEDDRRPKSIGELPQRQEAPVRAGDVLCVTPLGAWVPVTLFPTVGINRPGTDEWPILLNELDEIATWVRTQAVPRLITGADPPTPTLPTRYAISVEHEDERRAIATGSTTSAATRHAQRLGAASSRIDLIELLGSMDCSLDSAQIEAWLAQIPDHEVIERVSRLQATDGKDHATMQRNLRVLEQLRTEAVGFTG